MYLSLQKNKDNSFPIQLAQPVASGQRQGVAISALRLCVSSRLIVESVQHNNTLTIIERARMTLDRVAQSVDERTTVP